MQRSLFTLLELVVVMTIAVVLMTMGLTAFRDWNKGTEVEESSRLIGSLLLQTRQTALRQRRYTALLMPGREATGMQFEDQFKFARLAYVTRDGNAYNFDEWVGSTEWVKLPPGVTIMEVDTDMGIHDGSTFVRYPVENNSPTVDGVDLSVRFNASNDVDGIRGIVFSPSGKVKISQTMYITVGDGRHVAGQWIIHRASRLVNGSVSQEIGPANQITLKINRYTAHNSYVTPPDYVDGWHVE